MPVALNRRSPRVSTRSAVEEVAFAAEEDTHHGVDREIERTSFREMGVPGENGGVSASARALFDLHPASTAGRSTFSGATRSTATGFASGMSDATLFMEGEGEASTPRNARQEAKRAAQNNLKRKLEKLAQRHERGTFLAMSPRKQKTLFKTPPRLSVGVTREGDSKNGVTACDVSNLSDFLLDQNAAQLTGDLFNSPCLNFKHGETAVNGLDVNALSKQWDVVVDALREGPSQADVEALNADVMRGMRVPARASEKIIEEDDGCSVASDTGAGFDERVTDAFAEPDDGSGRRTLRNLLVSHVISGVASDAVGQGVGQHGGNPVTERVVTNNNVVHAVSKEVNEMKIVLAKENKNFFAAKKIEKVKAMPFDTPPRTGYGMFRGRSGGNLKDLVKAERRASASPSCSEGFTF